MDIELYYQQKGCGQPLILLHGNGENSDCFQAQIEEFSKYFHVYAIDTRGHGKTLRGTKPFTIRQFAKDLANFMDLHHIPQAHLLGFSDGGNIAIIRTGIKTRIKWCKSRSKRDEAIRFVAH